jgi:flagellar biosynthesis protein FliR
MADLVNLYRAPLLVFLAVLLRLSGLTLLAPVFAGRQAPRAARLLLALALALLIAPLHWTSPLPQASQPLLVLAMLGQEAVLGLIMGLSLLVLGGGLQIAGQLVGQASGVSLGELFDPERATDSTPFGRCFELVAIAVFLLVGGHREVLAALLDTFAWLPPGKAGIDSGLVETFVQIVSQSFVLGIRAAAPVFVAVLLATLVLGLVSRAWPALHTFSVGLSLNALIAVALLSLSLGGAAYLYREHTDMVIAAFTAALASGK